MSRTTDIAKVLSKYGLDWLAHSESPWRVVAYPSKLFRKQDSRSQPERLRLALEELGATYIKLGQAISTRTDLLPPEYVKELAKLQDQAPHVPYVELAAVIEDELGAPPHCIFAFINKEPLAAASIGQVHEARLADGRKVVIKIQRPGTDEQVRQDLAVLQELVDVFCGLPATRDFDLQGWLDEFAFTFLNELDYRREGRNADRFRENFVGDPALHIPIVHWEYSSKRILTLEEVGGIKISDVDRLDAEGIDRKRVAQECTRIVLEEIFKFGLFHADPHAGNFFVQANGTIELIDFGMVGRLDRYERDALMRMTLALMHQDANALIDELLSIGSTNRIVKRQELKLELQRLMQNKINLPPQDFSLATLFEDVLRCASTHHIMIQRNMLFLARALAMCEGLGMLLDPEFRLMDAAQAHLKEIYKEERSPEALLLRAKESYVEVGEWALEFPQRLRRVFGQIERGEFTVTARVSDLDQMLEHFHRAVNRLSVSVLVAGIVAGLSVLSLALPKDRASVALWTNLMLMVAIGGGVVLIASIWRSRRV